MADYVSQSDIEGLIPAEFLTEAMDDDGDGSEDTDIWTKCLTATQREIDGRLGGRYTVPFSTPIPAVVSAAAQTIVLYFIYKRRGVADDANPWAKQATDWFAKLDRIGKGEDPLKADVAPDVPGDVVGEDAKLFSQNGNLMV